MEIEIGFIDISQVVSPGIKKFYAYYQEKCRGRQWPSIEDINLNELSDIADYLISAEYHYPPLKIQYTNVGKEIERCEGVNTENMWLHEVEDYEAIDKLAEINAVKHLLSYKKPVFGIDELYWLIGLYGREEYLEYGMFPLSDDGEKITHNISFNDYSQLKGKEIQLRDGY